VENLIGIILVNKILIIIMHTSTTYQYNNLIEEFIAFMPYRFYVDGIIQMKVGKYFNG